ncbi:MAG TPA: hypothetical protein V6D02_13890 [Candidatus Obscuribacterales bacterium]
MKLDESAIATLGASLRPINPALMKGTPDKKRLWYQGSEPYFDVTIDTVDEHITWFQITLRGKVISWRSPHYLYTGETDELDVPPEVAYYAASKTIRDGVKINWPLVDTLQAVLAQRPDDPLLTQVSAILKTHLTDGAE